MFQVLLGLLQFTAFTKGTKMIKARFIKKGILLSLAAIIPLLSVQPCSAKTIASPTEQRTQVAGYHRMMLGDFEVTALYDGFVRIESKLLIGITEQEANEFFERMYIDSSNGVQTAVNAFLVNTGKNLILIDAGAAKCFGPTSGEIQNNIRAAGYTPEQIDAVLLTHLHPDHACGITKEDDTPAFPNATVYVAKKEADYWLSKKITKKAPEELKPVFEMAQKAVAPYQAKRQFKTFTSNNEILPGVRGIDSMGHTPGHSSYLFTSQKQNLLVWGDIIHSHSMQFARPEVAIEYDVDNKQASITRHKLLASAARHKLWIAGAHLPFPGLGHVRAEQQGYTWVPIEYSPVK